MKKIGRYDVLNELGRGAMGVVYAAEDPLIGRTVAIKTIRFGTPEAGDDRKQLVQRLHREAQAAGVLSHPGIVTIHDVGEQDDEAYIVMEFVDGKTAEDMFASNAPQHPSTCLSILRGTAAAIDYAHSKGIIHRDIKPSNIMVCHDGTVKIADFGVAKLTTSNSLTQTGFVVGTPSYMSPEQAQGRTIDGRSDQFSLAVVAFRMLSGKLPFEGPSLTALLTKILWEEPEYESVGMNPAIRPVFKRALSKDPQLRFPTCGDFVRGLEEAFAAGDSAMIGAVSSIPQPGAASAGFNAALPGFNTAAGMKFEASRYDQGGVSQRTGGDKQDSSTPSAALDTSAPARKRKLLLIAWVAGLGLIALVLAAIFAFRAEQRPAASVQSGDIASVPPMKEGIADSALPSESSSLTASPDNAPVPQSTQVRPGLDPNAVQSASTQSPPALRSENRRTPVQDAVEQKPAKKPATVALPVSAQNVTPEASAPRQKQGEESAAQPQSASGVLTWTGELERNSLLVITEQRSSIGSVVGQLPGKPVKIVVEPKSLSVRQLPGEANGWSQIILYSGNQRYSSIEIRWSIVE